MHNKSILFQEKGYFMNREITIYHSPDADDAFMFYGLTSDAVKKSGLTLKHELSDIESLNQRTLKGELEVTAISVHAYPYLSENYVILNCGGSFGGEKYGPSLVCKKGQALEEVGELKIAIPGKMTSAALVVQLYLKSLDRSYSLFEVPFLEVEDVVKSGKVDLGVIIHEGQLTYQEKDLDMIQDLGAWWWSRTSLPLPLGVNVAKKSLGVETIKGVSEALKDSIIYSLEHRADALNYALQFSRGLTENNADIFVSMYVNELTLNMGEVGRKAIQLFLEKGYEAKILGVKPKIEFE